MSFLAKNIGFKSRKVRIPLKSIKTLKITIQTHYALIFIYSLKLSLMTLSQTPRAARATPRSTPRLIVYR